jgi:hypothetical protein
MKVHKVKIIELMHSAMREAKRQEVVEFIQDQA